MDGSSTKADVLVRNYVSNDTSVTLDFDTEKLYWVSPGNGSGYTSDIEGQAVSTLFHEPNYIRHPTSIGIYKVFVLSKLCSL